MNIVQQVCGCGHKVADHDASGCMEWWRYPDVLNARPCGCKGVWRPDTEHSQYVPWAQKERQAGGFVSP